MDSSFEMVGTSSAKHANDTIASRSEFSTVARRPLKMVFLFLIALLTSLFNHGRFLCDGKTFFGRHSSIFSWTLSTTCPRKDLCPQSTYYPSQRPLFLTSFAPVSVELVPDCTTWLATWDYISAVTRSTSRPVARIFRKGVTQMSNLQKHTRPGRSGGMLPQEVFRN